MQDSSHRRRSALSRQVLDRAQLERDLQPHREQCEREVAVTEGDARGEYMTGHLEVHMAGSIMDVQRIALHHGKAMDKVDGDGERDSVDSAVHEICSFGMRWLSMPAQGRKRLAHYRGLSESRGGGEPSVALHG